VLSQPDWSQPKSIHRVRVPVKRLRALWTLLEPGLGRDAVRPANHRLRDASRLLSRRRDEDVMRGTVHKLARDAASKSDRRALEAVHAALCRSTGGDSATVAMPDPADIGTAFHADAAAWRRLSSIDQSASAIHDGLKATYRKARTRGKAALKRGEAEAFHDWRKWSKALLYQMQALQTINAVGRAKTVKRLDKLGKQLGRRNDLDVLLTTMQDTMLAGVDKKARKRVTKIIRKVERTHEQAAARLQKRIFNAPPKAFVTGTLGRPEPEIEIAREMIAGAVNVPHAAAG